VSDLDGLDEARWATPSLAQGWTVEDVVAHLVATAKMTPPRFFTGLAASGFRFNSMSAKALAAEKGGSGAETLARYRAVLYETKHPPGPLEAMVGEQVVHGEDVRRPLGLAHTYPPEALAGVADFYRKSNLLLGGKRRVAGLRLQASDMDWSRGDGPEVTGPMLDLVLAIAGRRAGLDRLGGTGLATLKART
jgi:uncharacterized protein (TIGR03083 family)